MKKWILTALFLSFCTSFAWGHFDHSSHTHQRSLENRTFKKGHQRRTARKTERRKARKTERRNLTRQLSSIINHYYHIHNHLHYDHGHSYPVCTHHGCSVPCNYHFYACPLITANIVFPVIPVWFTMNIHASIFYACQNQYQWCLWSTPFYLQGACTNQYFSCMGYTPPLYYYP